VSTHGELSSRTSCQVFDKLDIRTTLPQRVHYVIIAKRCHVIAYLTRVSQLTSLCSPQYCTYPCAFKQSFSPSDLVFIIQVHLLHKYSVHRVSCYQCHTSVSCTNPPPFFPAVVAFVSSGTIQSGGVFAKSVSCIPGG
jgi:hypothetical protein